MVCGGSGFCKHSTQVRVLFLKKSCHPILYNLYSFLRILFSIFLFMIPFHRSELILDFGIMDGVEITDGRWKAAHQKRTSECW